MAITWTPFSGGAFFTSNFAGGTHTFSNLNGGTNFPAGSTVVAIIKVDKGDLANLASNPACGGNAMTRGAGNFSGASSSGLELWYADLASSTTDSITFGNGSQFVFIGIVGGYLTGVSTGGPSVTSEQQFGQQNASQTLALTPANGGIGVWGFNADTSVLTNAIPVWANVSSSSSDEYVSLSSKCDLAVAHAAGTGASITATVTPTGGGTNYDFVSGLLAAGWIASSSAASVVFSPYLGDDLSASNMIRNISY